MCTYSDFKMFSNQCSPFRKLVMKIFSLFSSYSVFAMYVKWVWPIINGIIFFVVVNLDIRMSLTNLSKSYYSLNLDPYLLKLFWNSAFVYLYIKLWSNQLDLIRIFSLNTWTQKTFVYCNGNHIFLQFMEQPFSFSNQLVRNNQSPKQNDPALFNP